MKKQRDGIKDNRRKKVAKAKVLRRRRWVRAEREKDRQEALMKARFDGEAPTKPIRKALKQQDIMVDKMVLQGNLKRLEELEKEQECYAELRRQRGEQLLAELKKEKHESGHCGSGDHAREFHGVLQGCEEVVAPAG